MADFGAVEVLEGVGDDGVGGAVLPEEGREGVVVVAGVHEHGGGDLLELRGAGDLACLLAGLRQGRQQHGRQDGDDGDDDEQLNQGEGSS